MSGIYMSFSATFSMCIWYFLVHFVPTTNLPNTHTHTYWKVHRGKESNDFFL